MFSSPLCLELANLFLYFKARAKKIDLFPNQYMLTLLLLLLLSLLLLLLLLLLLYYYFFFLKWMAVL